MLLLVPVPRFDVDALPAAGQASARTGFARWKVAVAVTERSADRLHHFSAETAAASGDNIHQMCPSQTDAVAAGATV